MGAGQEWLAGVRRPSEREYHRRTLGDLGTRTEAEGDLRVLMLRTAAGAACICEYATASTGGTI